MVWTAWNNGKHHSTGAGYGLKVPIADRDAYFDRSWRSLRLELPFRSGRRIIEVSVSKASFWEGRCHELIHKDIGLWLIEKGLARWPRGRPPKIEVVMLGEAHFALKGVFKG